MPLLKTLLSWTTLASAIHAAFPVIDTAQGQVRGVASPYRDNVTVYRGIPFAAPPTGNLRFTPPKPPANHSGVLEAKKFGPQCVQTQASSAGIFYTGSDRMSEDCLYLNIWTPTYDDDEDIKSKNLPVYYWIYGGRYEMGSGDVKTYDGSGLAIKDVIVVTVNYRVGAFGYFAHPELSAESPHNSSGNYGTLDQIAGLKVSASITSSPAWYINIDRF
jgi:carboxylesterase 2